MKKTATLALLACLVAAPALAQDAQPEMPKRIQPIQLAEKQPKKEKPDAAKPAAIKTLSVGDPAPAYKVEAFVKGQPVASFEKGKVYVVEFWATWCGPCVAAFPHLSEVQAQYKNKGVVVIGTNVFEQYDAGTLARIKAFVTDQGENMEYTVAYDGKAGAMAAAYMTAAGQNGIPCAFIVNQEGIVAWIGHPSAMNDVLAKIVDKTYDMKAAAEASKATAEAAARRRGADEKTADILAKMRQASRAKKWDEVISGFDELIKADPDRKGEYLLKKFGTLLNQKSDYAAAYAMKDALINEPSLCEKPEELGEIAWTIVKPGGSIPDKERNLDFAMAFASKANDLSKGEDPMILDTLARIYFFKSDLPKAVEYQQKAIAAVELDPDAKEGKKEALKSTLESYKKEEARLKDEAKAKENAKPDK